MTLAEWQILIIWYLNVKRNCYGVNCRMGTVLTKKNMTRFYFSLTLPSLDMLRVQVHVKHWRKTVLEGKQQQCMYACFLQGNPGQFHRWHALKLSVVLENARLSYFMVGVILQLYQWFLSSGHFRGWKQGYLFCR